MQKNAKVVNIDLYEDVPVNDEIILKKAVSSQPVSVAIEGSGRSFQLYESVISFDLFIYCKGSSLISFNNKIFYAIRGECYGVCVVIG